MSIFSGIGPIEYEGPETDNPFAFRYYNKDAIVHGRRMEDHLRMAVCYWHSFCWPGSDVFGDGTFDRPWMNGAMTQEMAEMKLEAAFDFFARLGAPFFCFHDVDVMADATTFPEHVANLDKIVDRIEAKMAQTGVKLLWGTANLFGHPRYAAGAATNPDPEVFAFAAGQVRHCLEATARLGGANYVMWGGREGYDTLLNTNMARELDQLGRFLSMVVEHKHKIGFKGTLLIEPKPHEPTKHQYDHDVATIFGFLKQYGLENEIRVNIEVNHATLAGHSFEHELAVAIANGILGSVDINRGDPQNGWDTDQFPNNVAETTIALYHILKSGGFNTGGFNFDAKLRRLSLEPADLFHAHIGGMDTLASGLLNAARIIEDGTLDRFVEQRYEGWNGPLGQDILQGKIGLTELSDKVMQSNMDPKPVSGRQELLENLVNRFV